MKGKFREFRLLETGFEFRGTTYPDSLIRHILLAGAHTVIKTNFVRTGDVHAVKMGITLTNGQMVVLQAVESGGLISGIISDVFSSGEDPIVGIYKAAETLMKRTEAQRTVPYADEWKKKGYFTYDGCRFYPPEKIVFRDREFLLSQTTFQKYDGCIVMSPTNFSLAYSLKRHLTFCKTPQFNTQTDTDVIFGFLKDCFGLNWQ